MLFDNDGVNVTPLINFTEEGVQQFWIFHVRTPSRGEYSDAVKSDVDQLECRSIKRNNMIGKITHLTIYVHQQDEALDFYTNKMGYRVHTDVNFGNMRWLTVSPYNVEDFEIALIRADEISKDLVGKQSGAEPLAIFYSDDCERTYLEMKKKGVKFLSEPIKEEWGINVVFEDLYGNKFALNQPR